MKFVISAILLVAFAFILTSCHLDGAALAGKGEAHPPYYNDGGSSISPITNPPAPSHSDVPACPMELQASGAIYIEPKTLADFLTVSSQNNRLLLIKVTRVSGLLPTIANVRYQNRGDVLKVETILRDLLCKDTTPSGDGDHRFYECSVPRKNDQYDAKLFYLESLELHVDGYAKNFTYQERQRTDVGYSCFDNGTEVWLGNEVFPGLYPASN